MKISRFLAIAGLVAAGTAVAHGGGNSSILFKFNGGTGNQVFRSAAGVPTLNTVAGVNPARRSVGPRVIRCHHQDHR